MLAIERLSAPPNPKIAVKKVVPAIERLAGSFYILEEALEVTFHENLQSLPLGEKTSIVFRRKALTP